MREMFTEKVMSEANREMLVSLVGDLSSQLVALVATARAKAPGVAQAELDQGPFRAEEARERGLIDATQYWDEVWDEVRGDEGQVEALDAYRKRVRRRRLWPRRATQVALLRITGNIRSGHDRFGPNGPRATGDSSLRRALRQVAKSRRIRAMVIRVDSPGGSALASDLMWRELCLAAQKKHTFVSMVNVAASGGYYTSGLSGVPIWANPTTLTGSIGVVGGKFEVSQLLSKLGVSTETIASGPRANFHSVTTPWGEADLQKMDRDMEALYRDFVTKMAGARGLSYEALDAVARGRVWTGLQARGVALVDHIGGLFDVTMALRERLGLDSGSQIQWVAPSAPRGLRARQEADAGAEELMTLADPLLRGLPELGESLGRAIDLRGERLLTLSLVYPANVDAR
jgi:protease-4